MPEWQPNNGAVPVSLHVPWTDQSDRKTNRPEGGLSECNIDKNVGRI